METLTNENDKNETDTNKTNNSEIISISSDDVSIEYFDAETVEQMEEKKKSGMTIEKRNHWEKFAFEEDQLKKNAKKMLQREFQHQINFLNIVRVRVRVRNRVRVMFRIRVRIRIRIRFRVRVRV